MPKYIIGLKIKFKIRAVGHNFFKAINFDWSSFIFTWPIIITTSIKKVTFSTLKKNNEKLVVNRMIDFTNLAIK